MQKFFVNFKDRIRFFTFFVLIRILNWETNTFSRVLLLVCQQNISKSKPLEKKISTITTAKTKT